MSIGGKRKLWRSVCVLFLVVSPQALSVELPGFMHSSWVGEEITHNGFPMQIQSFRAKGKSVEDVLNFYRSLWANGHTKGDPRYVEESIAGWQIISHLDGDTNTVIQIRDSTDTGVNGFISVLRFDVKDISVVDETQFPTLTGSQLISSTSSGDQGVQSLLWIFRNSYSVESNVDFYKSKLSSLGFSMVHESDGSSVSNARVMFFNSKKKRIELGINKDAEGKTVIVGNVSET